MTDIKRIARAKAFHVHGNTKRVNNDESVVDYESLFNSIEKKSAEITKETLAANTRFSNPTLNKLFGVACSNKTYDKQKLLEIFNEHYSRKFELKDEPWNEYLYTSTEASSLFVMATKKSHRKFVEANSLNLIPSIRFNQRNLRYRKVDLIEFFQNVINRKLAL